MRRAFSRRPSASMMVALTALFVALGGSAVAATLISGSRLKNRSVPGAKLKKDTLGGTEIKESKVGKVPSAKHADSAASADSAGTAQNSAAVGGMTLRRFNFQAGPASTPKTVVDLRGLRLEASCAASTHPVLTAVNATPSGKSEIEAHLQSNASTGNPRSLTWSPGDTFEILKAGDVFATGIGTVVFSRQDGQGVVTVNFLYDNGPSYGTPNTCAIAGTVTG